MVKNINMGFDTFEEDIIRIPISEYSSLKKDVKFLRALEAAGVDNWEGYDIAQNYLEKSKHS